MEFLLLICGTNAKQQHVLWYLIQSGGKIDSKPVTNRLNREFKHRRFRDANGDRKTNTTAFGKRCLPSINWKTRVLA